MNNIVLYNPEIPQNTGNIIRTCAASNIRLHLIEPLGFSLEEKFLKRASLDYFDLTNIYIYKNFNCFLKKENPELLFFITRYGKKTYNNIQYKVKASIYFVFGNESSGIPKSILKNNINNCFRIPMDKNVRSLNLSNCVSIIAYEYLKNNNFPGLSLFEPDNLKGKEYLEE